MDEVRAADGEPSEGAVEDLRVRPADTRDIETLVEFNRALARETEEKELDPERLRAGVAALFREPRHGGYALAVRGQEPLGCLMLTHEWSDWRNGVFWWIQSVYVVPSARGSGVFRRLYDDVIRRAREADRVCGVRLYVERENEVAQRVYQAVGMSPSHYRLFEVDFVLGSAGDSGERDPGAPPGFPAGARGK